NTDTYVFMTISLSKRALSRSGGGSCFEILQTVRAVSQVQLVEDPDDQSAGMPAVDRRRLECFEHARVLVDLLGPRDLDTRGRSFQCDQRVVEDPEPRRSDRYPLAHERDDSQRNILLRHQFQQSAELSSLDLRGAEPGAQRLFFEQRDDPLAAVADHP